MTTQISVFGGATNVLAPGWVSRTHISLLGGSRVDATALPGANARLRCFNLFGGCRIRVTKGSRVDQGGFSILGGVRNLVIPDDSGPEIAISVYSAFGGVRVEPQHT